MFFLIGTFFKGAGMVVVGIATLNPLLIAGGVAVSVGSLAVAGMQDEDDETTKTEE